MKLYAPEVKLVHRDANLSRTGEQSSQRGYSVTHLQEKCDRDTGLDVGTFTQVRVLGE